MRLGLNLYSVRRASSEKAVKVKKKAGNPPKNDTEQNPSARVRKFCRITLYLRLRHRTLNSKYGSGTRLQRIQLLQSPQDLKLSNEPFWKFKSAFTFNLRCFQDLLMFIKNLMDVSDVTRQVRPTAVAELSDARCHHSLILVAIRFSQNIDILLQWCPKNM